MTISINAVNFEMAKKLEDFIEKKMNRFARQLKEDDKVEIRMSVVKPQTNLNKETKIRFIITKQLNFRKSGIDIQLWYI